MTHLVRSGVWVIEYRCLVLDDSYTMQFHLNLFSNIVLKGVVPFTTTSTFYTTVDYTTLATNYGYTFNTFTASVANSSDYSSTNKVVAYISCFGYSGQTGIPILDV